MSSEQIFGYDGWFRWMFRDKLASRWPTMHAAVNLWQQRGGHSIVETGCARLPDDWGGGMSTWVLAHVAKQHGGYLWSVDITPKHVEFCNKLTEGFADVRTVTTQDSVEYLKAFDKPIDLLYLDSFDYPFGVILEDYGGKGNLEQTLAVVQALPEADVVARYANVIGPCQEHCRQELFAALPNLHDKSVILIDDNNLAGGGKSRTAKYELIKMGWICVLDCQQSLWIRS